MPPLRALAVLAVLFSAASEAHALGAASASSPFAAEGEPITAIPSPPPADPRKLALGERLFQDRRLSKGATRSCSSCHDVRTNGADARRRDAAVDGTELPLNTNTVFNAALSFRFDWDGGVRTLEAQARRSIDSPETMGSSIDEVVRSLRADPVMVRQFNEAYGHGPDRESLIDAIATYERSLLTPGSRFDRWLGGDTAALTAQERDGYKQFKTLGCISCHQGVNVGGNLFERFGVFRSPARATSRPLRVPSLRNVATTAPYFHDGSAPTLEDAVRRMGRAQLGLNLSDAQVEAIVSFLKTLTGTYRDRPVTRATR